MPYNVKLPNGKVVAVDDDVPREQARLMIVREFPDLFERKQGFVPAVKGGFEQGIGSLKTFGADLADKAGLNNVAKSVRGSAEKNFEQAKKDYDPTTPEDVDAAFDKQGVMAGAGTWANRWIGEQAGNMVGRLAPSALGAAVGSMAGPVGAQAGFAAPFFAQSAGDNQIRQREVNPGQDPNLLASTTTALAQTALGMFGFGKMVNGAMGAQMAANEARKLAPKVLSGELSKEAAVKQLGSQLRNVAAETGASFGINATTGIADEGLRRGQAGQPLADSDALASYRDIAIGSAILAPVFGGFHGAGARNRAEGVLTQADNKVQQQKRVEQETQQAAEQQRIEADELAAAVVEQQRQETGHAVQQDMFGRPQLIDPAAPRAERSRAADVAERPPLELDGSVQQELPLAPPEARPPMTLGEAPRMTDDGQPMLPLQSAIDPRPPLTLEAQAAPQADLPLPRTERTRADDVVPQPKLSTRDDFKGLVYETSPTWKQGKLDGHNLETPDGVQKLQSTLKQYWKNLEDNEKNAARRTGLQERIDHLETLKPQLKPQPELDLKGGKHVPAADSATDSSLPAVTPETRNEAQQQGGLDAGPSVPHLEVRSGTDAVPDRLPAADGPADGAADRLAGSGAARQEPLDAALSQGVPERTPLQERADFGRAIGATVDAGGNYLKGRQNAKLGQAMEAKDFDGVVSALAGSKNVMVKHIGEQAAKLEGVKVQIADAVEQVGDPAAAKLTDTRAGTQGTFDPKTNTASATESRKKDEHTVAHELAHAMTHTALDNPTAAQRPIVAKLGALHEHVKKAMPDERQYGLADLHEFVAEGYTNPDFQQRLAKVKYQNSTAWGKFTDYVARLLGLKPDNAFTEFLSLAEQLEGTGLKGGKSDAAVKPLGVYADATVPSLQRGPVGKSFDAVRSARAAGGKSTLRNLWDRAQVSLLDDKHGITRYLEDAWTRTTTTGPVATARALLQASTYNDQLARESLSVGRVAKNSEGSWEVMKDANNLRAMIDAVKELPVKGDENPFQTINGILTNLAYAEREAQLANKQSGAAQMQAQGRLEMKAAKTLKGRSAARAIAKAQAKIDAATDMLNTTYERPKSVTAATLAQAAQDAADPAVKKVLDVVRAINMQNIDMLEQGGVITPEAAKLWRQNKHYVPLNRVFEEQMEFDLPFAKGGAATREIKKFKSSDRDVDDITENLIRQRLYAVDAAMRNNANVRAMQELEATPTNPAGVTKFDRHPGGQDVITLKEDGVKVYYRVEDPLAFQGFRGLIEDAPGLVNAVEHFTRFFREAIMLSPDAIYRNLVRDTAEVWAYQASDKSFARLSAEIGGRFLKAMPGVAKEGLGNRVHQPHYDIQAFGITGNKEFTSLDAERSAILREHLQRTGAKDWAGSVDAMLNLAGRLLKPLQNAATEGELVPRNQVFLDNLAKTGSRTEASLAAINTLDFRRRGASQSITMAKKMIPFFNSSLQGIYKIIQVLEGRNLSNIKNPDAVRRAFLMQGLRMAAAATFYQMYMSEDEDYMAQRKDIRDRNILIKIGEDANGKSIFAKAPLPFEFGSMFWTMPANLLDLYKGRQNGQEFFDSFKSAILHATPPVLPQVVKPVLENVTNHSFFTGKPLESDSMQRLEPGQRAYSTTSSAGKAVAFGGSADSVSLSPIQADNLLKGYFGSLGQILVNVYDQMAGGDRPETPLHRSPLLRSVLTDPLASAHRDKFYELKDIVEKVHATTNMLAKSGKKEEADAFLAKETKGIANRDLMAMYRPTLALNRMLMSAAKAEKAVRGSDDSPEMKRARLEQIRRSTNHMVEKAMPGLRNALHMDEPEEEEEEDEGDDE